MNSKPASKFQHLLWAELDTFNDDEFGEVVDTIVAQIGYRHGEEGLKRFGLNVIITAADIAESADALRFALYEEEISESLP